MYQTLTKEQKKWLLIGSIVFTVGGTGTLINQLYSVDSLSIEERTPSVSLPRKQLQQHLSVHIAGAVAKPGLYKIPLGTRTLDALSFAGGPVSEANLDRINLAKFVTDGQRLYIPYLKTSKAKKSAGNTNIRRKIVSINAATASELRQIPGIGPSLAKRILHYRNNVGRIESLNELSHVKGISKNKIKELSPYLKP